VPVECVLQAGQVQWFEEREQNLQDDKSRQNRDGTQKRHPRCGWRRTLSLVN